MIILKLITLLFIPTVFTAPIENKGKKEKDYCSKLLKHHERDASNFVQEPARYGTKATVSSQPISFKSGHLAESREELIRKSRASDFLSGSLQYPVASDIKLDQLIKNCKNSVSGYDIKIVQDDSSVTAQTNQERLLSDGKYKGSDVFEDLSFIVISAPIDLT
ncbi:uncharacterized protein LOC141857371 [Brevipalpus obovatus]|uniref:uncharacterized protein LOC141857371 n=1 Tax=Brevipalpus obovatus TaxID=246614 RepID=UPI003D9ECC53